MEMHGIRFAPSPTGRFHLGNLRTAWISYQWAQALKEPWIIRIEDIDQPRVVSGADALQIQDLVRLTGSKPAGLTRQSTSIERHLDWLKKAIKEGLVYACTCTRKEVQDDLAASASAPHHASVYSGRCRFESHTAAVLAGKAVQKNMYAAVRPKEEVIAWRWKSQTDETGLNDVIVGRTQYMATAAASKDKCFGGFIPGYNWACAVDDVYGKYKILVRAWDLEHVWAIQNEMRTWLEYQHYGFKNYSYVFHTALVTQNDGHRLEKRTKGVTWDEMAKNGVSPKTLIEATFDIKPYLEEFKNDLNPETIWGETKKTMTLKELSKTLAQFE